MAPKRPILRYYGGKWRLAPKIIKWFPKHELYVEPFGGGASVLLRKDKSRVEIYNDLDGDVVNFFRTLRDNPLELACRLYLTPASREEYEKSLCVPDDCDDLERARLFFVGSMQNYQGGGVKHTPGQWRHGGPVYPKSFPDILSVCARIKDVYIECKDAFDIIRKYDGINTFFYIDPPYIYKNIYDFDMSKDEHIQLHRLLRDVDGYVIISTSRNELYEDLYWDWEVVELRGSYTAGKKGGKKGVEHIYMNYRL